MATIVFEGACPACDGDVVEEDDERGTRCGDCFVPLREANSGFVISRILKVKKCPQCGGSGEANLQKARPTDCVRCHGTGIVSTQGKAHA
jgi:DnaJ-class molecular chaperone